MLVPCTFRDYGLLLYCVPHLERLTPDSEDKGSLRQILMVLESESAAAARNHFLKLNPRQFRTLLQAFQLHGPNIPNAGGRVGEEEASNVRAYTRYLEAIERGEDAAPPDYLAEYRKEQGLPAEEPEEEDVP
jgi:hypothetical protein